RFELQPRERRLLDRARPVPLPGKAFDLLVCLVSRAPRLVKKDELLSIVWPDTIVEETNLNYTISLLRKALVDGRAGQRYIETVPRQGYRFVADVDAVDGERTWRPAVDEMPTRPIPLVQRQSEIQALESALARSRLGQRQVVFITGEAGIGKTSLVDR